MENLWVTQCGYIRLCTTLSIVITVTNFWKLFLHIFNREKYEILIGIRELSEHISHYCFKNTLSNDSMTPDKNIPLLDGLDDEYLAAT